MTSEEQDQVLRALYQVPFGPGGWVQPLEMLASALHAANFHLMVWSPRSANPAYSLTSGMDEEMEAQYRAHYGAIDPRRLLVADMEQGEWLACNRVFDARTVARSEFWQDYLIPGGCRYLLGTRLVRHQDQDVFFGLHRAPGQPAFSDDDVRFMRHLTGHFQNAVRMWLSAQRLSELASIGARALDVLEYGVLAVDTADRLVFANRKAEAMLREAQHLQLRLGLIHAAATADAEALTAALKSCRRSGQSHTLRVGRSTAPLCTVTVVALPPDRSALRSMLGANLLLLITDGRRQRLVQARQLVQLFGLTPAEARLARALAAGESLESYSAIAQVRLPTVRTQLQAVFEKTGTNRQADLVRQIVVVPAPRS